MPHMLRDGSLEGLHLTAGVGRAGLRASFALDAPADLFLDTATFGKRYAFVNGFLLGRYWVNDPQRTLYVPAPVSRAGRNELVVIALDHVSEPLARFVATPDLGHLEEQLPSGCGRMSDTTT